MVPIIQQTIIVNRTIMEKIISSNINRAFE